MQLEAEIAKRIFIAGVVAVAVAPRQHTDASGCSSVGGGHLSHSFRKLLLASLAINWLRLFLKLAEFKIMAEVLGIIQILSLTFLCFITPYILQTWMATRIYIGGRPGENLITPLYVSGILSVVGMFLAKTGNPNFWALNRLGTVVTGPPVLKTLKMYNSLTTVGSPNFAGRGNILCQTLYVVEVWCMVAQLLCAIGFAFQSFDKPKSEFTAWDSILAGFREISFVSGWTRVMVHSIFVNLLDELSMVTAPQAQGENNNNNNDDEEGVFENNNNHQGDGDDDQAMVSLVPRSKNSVLQNRVTTTSAG